jgi:hypothetical protein
VPASLLAGDRAQLLARDAASGAITGTASA